eukprot:6189486-Pleurochrysis_carterae.AAC.2
MTTICYCWESAHAAVLRPRPRHKKRGQHPRPRDHGQACAHALGRPNGPGLVNALRRDEEMERASRLHRGQVEHSCLLLSLLWHKDSRRIVSVYNEFRKKQLFAAARKPEWVRMRSGLHVARANSHILLYACTMNHVLAAGKWIGARHKKSARAMYFLGQNSGKM